MPNGAAVADENAGGDEGGRKVEFNFLDFPL